MDEPKELDIFFLAFGTLRSAIKEVEPNMKYYVYPGVRWKK